MEKLFDLIAEMEFMKLGTYYSLHRFWNLRSMADKVKLFIVRDELEANDIESQPLCSVLTLDQLDRIANYENAEVHLSRGVLGILFYQAITTIHTLHRMFLKKEDDLLRLQVQFAKELRTEKELHQNTANNFHEELQILRTQKCELEKVLEASLKEIKKYDLMMKNKTAQKTKSLLDKLFKENDRLEKVVATQNGRIEVLEAQINGVYQAAIQKKERNDP